MAIAVDVRIERFPLARPFTISRGTRSHAEVVVVELTDGGLRGRGEGVPNARYGESLDGTAADIRALASELAAGAGRGAVLRRMKAGAARSAVDCALWDLDAKRANRRVHQLAGLPAPTPVTTVYTISLGAPEAMAAQAAEEAMRPILKLKLGGDGDVERVRAVRRAAPNARLVADANEAWTPELFRRMIQPIADAGVEMVEQPLPAGQDAALADLPRPIPICADESCHTRADLAALVGRYQMINIKLDKTGGLTEALAVASDAREFGFQVMVGCMVGTSLSMAPSHLVAQRAAFVDIDAPLLLSEDRPYGLVYRGAEVDPPSAALWG